MYGPVVELKRIVFSWRLNPIALLRMRVLFIQWVCRQTSLSNQPRTWTRLTTALHGLTSVIPTRRCCSSTGSYTTRRSTALRSRPSPTLLWSMPACRSQRWTTKSTLHGRRGIVASITLELSSLQMCSACGTINLLEPKSFGKRRHRSMGVSYHAKEILSISLSYSPGGSIRREVSPAGAFGTSIWGKGRS